MFPREGTLQFSEVLRALSCNCYRKEICKYRFGASLQKSLLGSVYEVFNSQQEMIAAGSLEQNLEIRPQNSVVNAVICGTSLIPIASSLLAPPRGRGRKV